MSQCMSTGRSLYRIYDPAPSGCFEVKDFVELMKWEREKWGSFWTVNQFNGPRKKENCIKILSWPIDLDKGTKQEQRERIRSMTIEPSAVIETARGFHVYFDAIDGEIENYGDIVSRLVKKYGGDEKAKDISRILRVPYHMHWKNPEKPFSVKAEFLSESKFTENEIRRAFPADAEVEKVLDQKTNLRRELKFQKDGGLWDRVWSMDCEASLQRISGTEAMGCEKISFKRTSSGNLNILVDCKGTSCWIDKDKRIGSSDKGGPTIANWINWYHRDWKKTYDLLKKYFPEVVSNGK